MVLAELFSYPLQFSPTHDILFSMSMFREHWIGGIVTYTTFFIISLVATLAVSLLTELPLGWNPTIPSPVQPLKIIGCFAVAVLFGLWPDVDIKSKSQKIFYRVLFALNTALLVFGMYIESALLGLFAMLPIISKHRGWTHSKVTMFLMPCLFLVIPIYLTYPEWSAGWEEPLELIGLLLNTAIPDACQNWLPFYVASFIGYATHLHLDDILFQSRKAQRRKARGSQ